MDDLTRSTTQILEAAMEARMPTIIMGPPGTGKSAAIRELASNIGYDLITLVGSRMDPTDVSGIPKGEHVGEDENGEPIFATVNLSPDWQVKILRKKKVVLFLDEWGNSPGAVQAAFLTILQDREFPNGHKFPEETIIIGASNPPEEGADSFEMALPTTNRIFWISWNPTAASWYQGMLNAWGKKVSEEEMLWKHKIVGFLKESPSWLQKIPEEGATVVDAYGVNPRNHSEMAVFRYAWPSRRSWDNLSRVLAKAPDNVYVQDKIAQGIVGYAATAALRDWLRKNETISVYDVLADPKSVNWRTIELNDANMILRSVIDLIDNDTSEKALNVFETLADARRFDLGTPFMRDLLLRVSDNTIKDDVAKRNTERAKHIITKFTKYNKEQQQKAK